MSHPAMQVFFQLFLPNSLLPFQGINSLLSFLNSIPFHASTTSSPYTVFLYKISHTLLCQPWESLWASVQVSPFSFLVHVGIIQRLARHELRAINSYSHLFPPFHQYNHTSACLYVFASQMITKFHITSHFPFLAMSVL